MYIVAGAREGLSQKKVEGKDQHQKLTFELHMYACRHTCMHTHTYTLTLTVWMESLFILKRLASAVSSQFYRPRTCCQ